MARSVAAVLSVLLLAGSGWGWYLVRVADASVSRTDAIPDTGNSDVSGSDHAVQEMNLLLVGMDSRDGLTAEQQAEFSTGDPDGVLNTDSMMLVHVPADGSGASFVSLPRDTYVSIPGLRGGRLNSAYARGYNATEGTDAERDAAGAQLLIQTVSQFTGLQIDHFAEIDLLGFINLSTIVGGVEVNLCQATSDPFSGADFPAGVQTITGADALKFVRQRHGLPGRGPRPGRPAAGLHRRACCATCSPPNVLLDLGKQKAIVEQVGSSVTFDQGLDIFDLAAQMQSVQPGSHHLPDHPRPDADPDRRRRRPRAAQRRGRQGLLRLARRRAGGRARRPRRRGPRRSSPATSPSASSTARASPGRPPRPPTTLTTAGFEASSGGNADPTDTTTVRHHPGDEAAAALVAAQVPGAAVSVDDSVPAGTVQLVIGTDYNGIGQAVTAPSRPPTAPATSGRRTDTSCIN